MKNKLSLGKQFKIFEGDVLIGIGHIQRIGKMKKFLESLYFGDRYCEKMEFHKEKIQIQINCISRIAPGNTEWNYYAKDEIYHGQLIFEDISFFEMTPNMLINDEFYGIELIEENYDMYCFNF